MNSKPRLGPEPLVDPSAEVIGGSLGRYTEVAERCLMIETRLGDYSQIMRDSLVWATAIGKFVNIAAFARINNAEHPSWRPSQHHFTYRSNDYWPDADREASLYAGRREQPVTIGNDVWIGHGVVVAPDVKIGNGAAVLAGSIVTGHVAPYTIVSGSPARLVRPRFHGDIGERMDELAWWDWSHLKLRAALTDFRALTPEGFLEKYGG